MVIFLCFCWRHRTEMLRALALNCNHCCCYPFLLFKIPYVFDNVLREQTFAVRVIYHLQATGRYRLCTTYTNHVIKWQQLRVLIEVLSGWLRNLGKMFLWTVRVQNFRSLGGNEREGALEQTNVHDSRLTKSAREVRSSSAYAFKPYVALLHSMGKNVVVMMQEKTYSFLHS